MQKKPRKRKARIGRQPLPAAKRKSMSLGMIRISEPELERLKRDAAKAKIGLSDHVRRKLGLAESERRGLTGE